MGTGDVDAGQAAHLGLSGERTVPGVAQENYWFRRHEVAYRALLPWCAGRRVLDAGCGEGYGAALIAGVAAHTVALDYDSDATAHVRSVYGLDTVRGNLAVLPLGTGSVDVVVNFQVLEHLWDQAGFLQECHRVLRPGGSLLLTTPNRLTFSPGRDVPLNPYHTREFASSELDGLLRECGFSVRLSGVRHGAGLRKLDAAYGGSVIDAQLAVVLGSLPGQAQWPADLLADVAGIGAEDFEVTEDAVEQCLDLVAVGTRR